MLPRRHRLTKQDHMSSIFKKGKLQANAEFVIRFIKNTKKDHRFSVIVSQKIHAKAVDRNRLRRQLYEIIRLKLPTLPSIPNFDWLILPKKARTQTAYSTLRHSLETLLEKITKETQGFPPSSHSRR